LFHIDFYRLASFLMVWPRAESRAFRTVVPLLRGIYTGKRRICACGEAICSEAAISRAKRAVLRIADVKRLHKPVNKNSRYVTDYNSGCG
jgi:hypothetical protein